MKTTSALFVEDIRRAINALKTALPRVPFSTLVRSAPVHTTPNQNNLEMAAMMVTTKFIQDLEFEPNETGTHDVCLHLRRAIPRIDVDRIVEFFVRELKNFEQKYGTFDTFAFCGMSGALIAPLLAHLLGKELLMVRKNSGLDGSNASRSGFYVEGYVHAKRIVVVDDLISTGATMKNIHDGIKAKCPGSEFAAMVLYENYGIPKLYVPNFSIYECRHLWPELVLMRLAVPDGGK
jgi:adenine/guanine phosphoribosyltransferase-like PRPP-binding protein